jgi:hypothetical protein
MSAPGVQSALLEKATFHLEPMTEAEAREVMVQVPKTAGLPEIPAPRRRALWDALQVDGTVDAVVLSIACHELYGDEGKTGIEGDLDVDKLLGSYLRNALASLPAAEDYEEALDILGEIVGTGLTRGFVTQTQLLSAPLRNRSRRQRVLQELQKKFLIKGDNPRRGADKVYDIMHERLLEPMRAMLAERPDIMAVREAADRADQRDALRAGLSFPDCRALLSSRSRLSPDARASTVLLRSLLSQMDPLGEKESTRLRELSGLHEKDELVRWWRSTLLELTAAAGGSSSGDHALIRRAEDGWWMSDEEVAAYLQGSGTADGDWLALVSTLQARPGAGTRETVERLARRMGE